MNITDLIQLIKPPKSQFDGYLILNGKSVVWTISFLRGQLLFAEDQQHPVRRWDRSLKQHFPDYAWHVNSDQPEDNRPWQVRLLDDGINQKKLSLIRSKLMLRTLVQECLFELSLCDTVEHNWQSVSLPISQVCRSISLSSWENTMTFGKVKMMQDKWQEAGLRSYNPSLSPTLKKDVVASQLPMSLPIDHAYLRGDFTLWEIAGQLGKQPIEIAQALTPFSECDTLDMFPIPDLPMPTGRSITISGLAPRPAANASHHLDPPLAADVEPHVASLAPTRPLIACIDDSPVLAHSLKKILGSAGYQTLIIQEPMRGFSQLIEHRPDLILLDLMLPNADGYSICKFLRDTPVFKATPIIILTGQSKPIDRARARLAGATEFLSKPPQSNQLIKLIKTYLPVNSYSR